MARLAGRAAEQWAEREKRLRRHEAEPFVAVQIAAAEALKTPPPARVLSAPLELRLRDGRSLLVGPNFEASHLRRLLQILEQEP